MYDNDDFDGPSSIEKSDRRRKPRKAPKHGSGDGDSFDRKRGKNPYDKGQRRKQFDY